MIFKFRVRHFKLLSVVFCCLFFAHYTKAQYVTIPDSAFAAWLRSNNHIDSFMVGNQLDTTCLFILQQTLVDCSNSNILDLTGIQYFKALDTLICVNNLLDSLPAFPPLLNHLDFSFNAVSPN